MYFSALRHLLLILSLLVGSCCLLAAQGTMPVPLSRQEQDTKSAEVRELVSKYCRLDYDGARLDGQGWGKMEPLIAWKDNPEYAEINIISRYTVDPEPVESHGKYTVTVHYRLLGSYNLVTGYVPERPNTPQDAEYTVTDDKGDLRISDLENNLPHPSRAAMVKWLNDKLNATQDELAKKRYQDALSRLQAQPPSPLPKE